MDKQEIIERLMSEIAFENDNLTAMVMNHFSVDEIEGCRDYIKQLEKELKLIENEND
jgi:hypothetical protein